MRLVCSGIYFHKNEVLTDVPGQYFPPLGTDKKRTVVEFHFQSTVL